MLSRWIADLESADRNVRLHALQVLEHLGPAARMAVPALVAAWKKAAGRGEILPGLVRTLAAIGPDARAAVPLLVPLVDPSGAYMWGGAAPAFAILQIGGEPSAERLAVRSVLGVRFPRSTGMEEAEVLSALARKIPLGRIGTYLVEELADVRWGGAAEVLANYGAAAVPLLLPLLRQNTGPEQTRCIHALVAIGEPGIPALRQELRGPSVAGRLGAARTLGSLAGRAQDAFEDLVAALDDGAAEVRFAAAQALVGIAPSQAGAAIPHLVAVLESADAGIRGEAIRLLGLLARAGTPAEVALPALKKLLTAPELGLEAALTMVEIDAGQAAAAVPVLVQALERSKPQEIASYPAAEKPEAILAALGRVGPPAAAAIPILRQALQSPTTGLCVRAATALVRAAPEWTAEAVNRLVPLASAVDDDDFWMAIGALAEMGPAAREVVPRLEGWLFDEAGRGLSECYCPGDPVPQMFAALVRIDPAAPNRVLARIEADLQTPERFDQAVKLLLAMAAGVPASATLLASLLKDRRAEGQWDAIRSTLGGLGAKATDVAPLPQ
jgi:HEAT repeat protein